MTGKAFVLLVQRTPGSVAAHAAEVREYVELTKDPETQGGVVKPADLPPIGQLISSLLEAAPAMAATARAGAVTQNKSLLERANTELAEADTDDIRYADVEEGIRLAGSKLERPPNIGPAFVFLPWNTFRQDIELAVCAAAAANRAKRCARIRDSIARHETVRAELAKELPPLVTLTDRLLWLQAGDFTTVGLDVVDFYEVT